FDCPHRVSFDARNLHKSTDRVAGHPQMVLHGYFSGSEHLLLRSPHAFGQCSCCHRRGHANLCLAATHGGRNSGSFLKYTTDSGSSGEKLDNLFFLNIVMENTVIMQDGWNHARSTVGRSRDDAAKGCILLIDCQCKTAYPVEYILKIISARSDCFDPGGVVVIGFPVQQTFI